MSAALEVVARRVANLERLSAIATERMLNVAAYVGYALGLAGLLVTLWAWLRPRSAPTRLLWTRMASSQLISEDVSAVPSLEVNFRERRVQRLSTWSGKLWNGSTTPIRGEDVRNLRIEVEDGEVLGAWLSRVSSTENKIRVVVEDYQRARCTFDYLNPAEGGEITVLHTGPSDQEPELKGSIVGGSTKRVTATEPAEGQPKLVTIGMLGILTVGGFTGVGVLLTLFQFEQQQDGLLRQVMDRAIASETTFVTFMGGLALWAIAAAVFLKIRSDRAREPVKMLTVPRPGQS